MEVDYDVLKGDAVPELTLFDSLMAEDIWQAPDLADTVAVVTGASRGVGRGIAEVLGQCGATVVVTARAPAAASARRVVPDRPRPPRPLPQPAAAGPGRGRPHRPGTGRGAVRPRAGGAGRPARPGGVQRLGHEDYDRAAFDLKFWEAPPENWAKMIDRGVRMSYLAARSAAPLLIGHRWGCSSPAPATAASTWATWSTTSPRRR